MKKLPRKIKQWAEESYESLYKAIQYFEEEHTDPDDQDKLDLISYAPLFAAMNRGYKGKEKLDIAHEYVLENLRADFHAKDEDEPMDHSICFLLAYLDSHVAFELLGELKAEEVMEYLLQNYEIPKLA